MAPLFERPVTPEQVRVCDAVTDLAARVDDLELGERVLIADQRERITLLEDVLIKAHGALRGVVDATGLAAANDIVSEIERASPRCAAVRNRNP